MPVGNLIKHLIRQHGSFLLISSLLLGGFQFLICGIVSTIDIIGALQGIMKNVPPLFRSIIEEQFFSGLSSKSVIAFGWNHPISLALGAAAAIIFATRAVAGEIENGVMELLLSQPVSRNRYLSGQIIFAFVALAGLSLFGILGTFLGGKIYNVPLFSGPTLFQLALNYFLLQTVWYGIALLVSVHAREAGRVAIIGFLLALISYLISVIGKLWNNATFLLPYTINTYFSPQSILAENRLEIRSLILLALLCVFSISLAVQRFHQRDIP